VCETEEERGGFTGGSWFARVEKGASLSARGCRWSNFSVHDRALLEVTEASASLMLNDCEIVNSGIAATASAGAIVITDCLFRNNSALSVGGGGSVFVQGVSGLRSILFCSF
jgi:hypothetical protein